MIITEAVLKFSQLPAIAPIWKAEFNGEAIAVLEATSKVVSGTKIYRIYAAAAIFLGTIPDIWLIKRHDTTQLNPPVLLIAALNLRQDFEDRQLGIPLSSRNNSQYFEQLGTANVRGRVVG